MTPNPYQSPREAGNDALKPDLKRWGYRIFVAIVLGPPIAFAGLILILIAMAVVDYLRWQIGF